MILLLFSISIFFLYLKVLLIFDNIFVYSLKIEEYNIVYFYKIKSSHFFKIF